MDTELKATQASEIAPSARREFALVELTSLRTKGGARARVRCDRPDPVVVLEHFTLPGAYPKGREEAPSGSRAQNILKMLEAAPALVHRWTSFAGENGAEVRPAFHCDEAHAVPGSQPWADLSVGDQMSVVSALLEVGGFGGAADAEFPAGG